MTYYDILWKEIIMSDIYRPCPYCLQNITKKPVLQKLQGRYSILCPFCLAHRSEWVDTIDDAIISWNTYMRDDNPNITYLKMPLNQVKQGG